ncbi:MAG TPA: hypothetical protein VHJ78_05740 [Actinomycetota bacterium]|nr:hypothetical protein [Actinomycetota bacterium]
MADGELPLRTNRAPAGAGLPKRHLPRLDPAALSSAALAFRAFRAAPPEPVKPRIVSTAHGSLDHLLLTYPRYVQGELSYEEVYADLLAKLPKRTEITIFVHPQVRGDLERVVARERQGATTNLVSSPDFLNFTVWAEDPYVVLQDLDPSGEVFYLMEPFTFNRSGDALIAERVAQASPFQSSQSPLYFQGGNVLIGDDFVLLGVDYLFNTIETFRSFGAVSIPAGEDPFEFVTGLFRRTFGEDRRMFFPGTRLPVPQQEEGPITVDGREWTERRYIGTGERQPIFHIDMFLSLAGRTAEGRYRVLVGSPAEADRILGRPPSRYAMHEIFDDFAARLTAEGFEVLRNPLPLTYVDYPGERVREWYFATSNNCLVEIAGDSRRVWLPTYGHGPWEDLSATDEANKRIWEELGFEAVQLGDFNVFAQNLGAVHCIKKYLMRGAG